MSTKKDVELRSESSMSEKLETSVLLKFIKPFDGSRDKLCSFINNCDNAFKLASQSQKPLLLNYILCQLENKAETAASIKDFESWEQLSQFLQSQFGERKHYAHLLLDLQESQQLSNESVSQYSLRVESSLYKLLTEISLSNKKKVELSGKISAMEELALHCFIMGLTPKISNFVRMKNPQSLNEATNQAILEEKMQMLLETKASQNYKQNLKSYPMRDGRPVHNLNKQPAPICRYCSTTKQKINNPFVSSTSSLLTKHVTFDTNVSKPTKSSCAKSVSQLQNKKHTPSPCPTPIIPTKDESFRTERNYPVYEVTTNSQKRYLPHVSLNTQVNQQPLIFLVDTGSCVSLIKKTSITSMPNLVDDIIQLKGINSNNETVPTLGHFQLQLFVGIDTDLAYRFHVVEKIDLGYDGIIGTDFLNDLDGIIDYNSDVLKIRNFTIKIDYSRPVYKIFPRSETIIECTVSNPEQKVGLILDQHLSDSLLIANCIVSVKNNNRVNISVVNTSEELITLDSDIKVRIQPLHVNSFQVDPDITSAKSTISRREEVLNLLRTDHLNDEEKNSLTDICSQYFDIFYLPGDKLTTTDLLKHEINTHPAEPINVKSYRFPEIHKKEVDKQISKMLSQDIIKPSTSPWSFPIWIVPKKLDSSGETKWRIVIDYRKLNDITVGESYPIPQINEILDQLGQSKYFTTLDLCSGFHQISISEKDTPKTAFTVPQGHFEFKPIPPWPNNSSNR
ncbi:unnamed protein product [Pieris macdunnoughi]|uniref:Reverse transcriptase domain-containing protein n=1 Tax=Pieris macdunnoughi TaxID=345717 RepID=A0A821W8J3_9NEOP|nr:unnamed protein product [Pieris macdunnoughi]